MTATPTGDCVCQEGKPIKLGTGAVVCDRCGKNIKSGENSSTMESEEKRFGRWLIGQCQKAILYNQRMIDETRAKYGLKE